MGMPKLRDGDKPFKPHDDPVRAGYLKLGGQLARIKGYAHRPEVWTGTEWEPVNSPMDFLHNAVDIDYQKAQQMAAEQGIEGELPPLPRTYRRKKT